MAKVSECFLVVGGLRQEYGPGWQVSGGLRGARAAVKGQLFVCLLSATEDSLPIQTR